MDGYWMHHACMLCRYRNQTGVAIRPVDFGGLGGVDALDPGLPRLTPLYSGLTKAFKDEGYKERVDLFGAPYDFRLAGDGLQQVLSLHAHALRCHALHADVSRMAGA